MDENFKICWLGHPIAEIIPGKNYLEPSISLITDDILEVDSKNKLNLFLNKWISDFINSELKDLVNLNQFNQRKSSVRALCYQLFENNGVLKRDSVKEFIKNLNQEDRKILRAKGVKIGRYHVFLHRIFKPSAVTTRILWWKNFFGSHLKLNPPKFGLNFLNTKENLDQKFMLICGFEKFKNFFVRIDILERLFIKIIEKSIKNRIKLDSDMLNLLGCSKDNFIKLLSFMDYKVEKIEKKDEIYFKYKPNKINNRKKMIKKIGKSDNPFNILANVNFK